MAPEYNTMELMICVASRYLEDGKTVAVGTGAPCAAAMLAQKTSSPNLIILFEAGGVAPAAAARCRSRWATHAPSTGRSWRPAWPR